MATKFYQSYGQAGQQGRSKPVRRAPPRAARAGAAVFAGLVRKTKFAEPSLAENWPSIAGAEIAALCRPGRITGRGAGRTLELRAPSGAAATALAMHLDDLQTRVNRFLGTGTIARISILQTPGIAKTQPKSGDDASPLGQALASFRAAVSQKNEPSG